MSHRRGQLNMAHALAAHLGQRNLGAALFTLYAAVLHALVLSAQALVVLHVPKGGGTEKTFTLEPESPVDYNFKHLIFIERPQTKKLRRHQSEANLIAIRNMPST